MACSRAQRLPQLAQIVRKLRRMAKNPTDAIMKSSLRASVKVARVRAMAAQVILISVTLGFSGDSRTHGADLKFRPSQPPLAKSGPIELQDVDRACREWTNGCRVCERTANGEFNCSNIGIACQPTGGDAPADSLHWLMSVLGQKQTFRAVNRDGCFISKADSRSCERYVRTKSGSALIQLPRRL